MNNKLLAKHLFKLGFHITCITNYISEYNFYDANILKGCYHEWEHLKSERQTSEELENYDWENSVGIGTVAGYNNLHVIDVDGCSNYEFIEDILIILGLPIHYEWVVRSGSLDGYHIYFFSDSPNLQENQVASTYPPNLDNIALFEKIELLWNTHVVLPNSLHKSGSNYIFTNCKFPRRKPLFIEINKFEIIEGLFLNISRLEILLSYYTLSRNKHREIEQPTNINFIDLASINETLLFLFDTETDGLVVNGNFPNIIQISWIIMDNKGIVYKKNTELVNCNFDHNSSAFQINKLNPDVIRKIGKQPKEAYEDIMYDLQHCSVIIAHNLQFDLPILKNEFAKYEIDFNFKNIEEFCTMTFSEKLVNKGKVDNKYPKLTELYKFLFNHEVKQFHNANSDVNILAKCVKEMLYKKILEEF